MRVSIFVGDIADAPADVLCTSTNPRLSLMMGTGAAIRARGGYGILRECEAIVAREGPLHPGSVCRTTAGALEAKAVVHCVASDGHHRSSEGIVSSCVRNALVEVQNAFARTVAMPVFGSGHARLPLPRAADAMAVALRGAITSVEEVIFVVRLSEEVRPVQRILQKHFHDPVIVRDQRDEEEVSFWRTGNPFG